MTGPGGGAAIPYSSVPMAMQTGYQPINPDEMSRYEKDFAADPAHPGQNVDHGFFSSYYHDAYAAAKQHAGAILGMIPHMITQGQDPAAVEAFAQQHPELLAKEGIASNTLHAQVKDVQDMKATADKLKSTPLYGGMGGWIGQGAENIGEFLGLDGLSTLAESPAVAGEVVSQADKMGAAAKLAKTLEGYPKIAKLVALGLKTLGAAGETAGISGAQTYLDTGGDIKPTVESMAVGGAAGGAGAALGEGFDAAKSMFEGKATAAAERDAAQAAHENVPAEKVARTDAMKAQRQGQAQGQVQDVIQDATQRMVDRVNEAMAPPLAVTGETTGGSAWKPLDAQAIAGRVNSFGDLANEVRDAVNPISNALNEATDGKLADLRAERDVAYKAGDREAQEVANQKILDLAQQNQSVVTPDQYTAFRRAYADSKMLDGLHDAVDSSFKGPSAAMAGEEGTGTRVLRGTPLQNRLSKFLHQTPDTAISRVLGPDGLLNLHRAANLVSHPELQAATRAIAEAVAKEFPAPAAEAGMSEGAKVALKVGKSLAHIPVAGQVGEALVHGAPWVLQKMVTSPRVGQLMDYAVRNGVTPKVAASLIATEIRREQQPAPSQDEVTR